MESLIHLVPAAERNTEGLRRLLGAHPEIRFVSLAAIDLGGNDTDERIPAAHFLKDVDEYLAGGVQTDGSSVVLPGIATLNDGKVDLIADPSVNWFVDYNWEFRDPKLDLPVGTLRIPSFLKHRDQLVDSRAVLKRAAESVERRLLALLEAHPALAAELQLARGEIRSIELTAATELEFWVRTPGASIATEKLSVSQVLQESYWKRTKGGVRSALEHSLMMLEQYGLAPEMGHKEVGGVKATISGEGGFDDILEQLEIDWRYTAALQAADNELLARIVVKETFRRHGLEVTFLAKPFDGVAGSGEHTHVSITAVKTDGTRRNLFAPQDPKSDFLSPLGWGALMGLLRNYEIVGPFVTASNDAFNRLQPGFEAPVCIVASIGHDVTMPSRNRTVLVGLVRDQANPMATRFEIRAPNPHTNTFLALAAFYQAMLDGMTWAAQSGRSSQKLQSDFCKKPGADHPYLEKTRAYRTEEDVFEHFSETERQQLFGKPPATVWETMEHLAKPNHRNALLMADSVFTPSIVESYRKATVTHWVTQLVERIIPENVRTIRSMTRLEGENALDRQRWERIEGLACQLIRDDIDSQSLFTRIRQAVTQQDYLTVSALHLEMGRAMRELSQLYRLYRSNLV